jgi:hypothetical protein
MKERFLRDSDNARVNLKIRLIAVECNLGPSIIAGKWSSALAVAKSLFDYGHYRELWRYISRKIELKLEPYTAADRPAIGYEAST